MEIHTSTHNIDVSLAQVFQKHLNSVSYKHGVLVKEEEKIQLNKSRQTESITWKILNILITNMLKSIVQKTILLY